MNYNKKKTIALGIAAVFLFLALFDGWQYGFFTILRFVVFAATAYTAWMAYQDKQEGWAWMMGAVAVLFNPFIPVYLERETWVVIDALVGVFNLTSIWLLELGKNIK